MPTLPHQMDPRQPLEKAKLEDQEEVETDLVSYSKNTQANIETQKSIQFPYIIYGMNKKKNL